MTAIWLIALNFGKIISSVVSVIFIVVYIIAMMHALGERKAKKKLTISPALSIRHPA